MSTAQFSESHLVMIPYMYPAHGEQDIWRLIHTLVAPAQLHLFKIFARNDENARQDIAAQAQSLASKSDAARQEVADLNARRSTLEDNLHHATAQLEFLEYGELASHQLLNWTQQPKSFGSPITHYDKTRDPHKVEVFAMISPATDRRCFNYNRPGHFSHECRHHAVRRYTLVITDGAHKGLFGEDRQLRETGESRGSWEGREGRKHRGDLGRLGDVGNRGISGKSGLVRHGWSRG
ncbi:hypothetical protein H257_17878 [Aphanomyces astaci]|uniref:Uncharacterized protein n=1 Tax=Aphanomyces astaci TaxID=112090 RepID=W4FD17_APHAT|nr:hypothetical protein H257_17878 [Aphanomyces astaci]ETV65387.1 hypothetical protein H257_17878 [Aphanomyces astaci]|eukprot:XP_009845132.1 hypothetical protein H257_17878 [Aphanomyces astaci]